MEKNESTVEKKTTKAKGPVKVKVTCKGKSPLLMNPATEDLLESLRSGVRKQLDKNRSAEEMAEEKIIKNGKGEIGLPIEYLLAALKGGGRLVKNGKKQISTATSTTLFALMEFEEIFLPFKNQEAKMTPDMRKGKLPKDGTAVAIVRPRFDEWEFTVTITLNPEELDQSIAKKLFEEAGSKIGLGDFRPSCNGPFGRFMVADWVVLGSNALQNGHVAKPEEELAHS